MNFWRENVDKILEFQDKKVLMHAGSVSNAKMEAIVSEVYEEYDAKRKKYEALQVDNEDMEELKKLEEKIKQQK